MRKEVIQWSESHWRKVSGQLGRQASRAAPSGIAASVDRYLTDSLHKIFGRAAPVAALFFDLKRIEK